MNASQRKNTGAQEIFEDIYEQSEWGDDIRSGLGSEPSSVIKRYASIVEHILSNHNIRTVADLGCGDWSFSRQVNWSGKRYIGYDVVPSLIEAHTERFGADNIRFEQRDLMESDLPLADLALCKDVLQHWPNAVIDSFLERLSSFRWALLTNDCDNYRYRLKVKWPLHRKANQDIELGKWHAVRLREPPFDLEAELLGKLEFSDGEQRWLKEVLLWTNPKGDSQGTL